MKHEDRLYWERRAKDALDLAQRAIDPAVVRVHYELLSLYLDRLFPAGDGSHARPDRPTAMH